LTNEPSLDFVRAVRSIWLVSAASNARVAAYVREPEALSLRNESAKKQAIVDAQPFLEQQGWSELEFRGAEWDDDPQSGRAFYIYYRGVPPGGREAVEEIGTQCIAFSPPQHDVRSGSWIVSLLHRLFRQVARRHPKNR
jgi:hypothetical protein